MAGASVLGWALKTSFSTRSFESLIDGPAM